MSLVALSILMVCAEHKGTVQCVEWKAEEKTEEHFVPTDVTRRVAWCVL